MKTAATFEAKSRENTGKSASRALRREGRIPAVLYSSRQEPVAFSLSENELKHTYEKGGFMSSIFGVSVEGKTYHVLPKAMQFHPVTDRIEHADFLQVEEKSRIAVKVPVRYLNADRSPGLKSGGTLNIVRREIELMCTPGNIPTGVEVDLANVKIGESVHISAINLPKDVTPVLAWNFTLAAVTGRKAKDDATGDEAAAATTEGEGGEA